MRHGVFLESKCVQSTLALELIMSGKNCDDLDELLCPCPHPCAGRLILDFAVVIGVPIVVQLNPSVRLELSVVVPAFLIVKIDSATVFELAVPIVALGVVYINSPAIVQLAVVIPVIRTVELDCCHYELSVALCSDQELNHLIDGPRGLVK